jgi:hypothetical protein
MKFGKSQSGNPTTIIACINSRKSVQCPTINMNFRGRSEVSVGAEANGLVVRVFV